MGKPNTIVLGYFELLEPNNQRWVFYKELTVQMARKSTQHGASILSKGLAAVSEHDSGQGSSHMKMDQACRVALLYNNHPCDKEPSPARLC